jgi:hypothetical protein
MGIVSYVIGFIRKHLGLREKCYVSITFRPDVKVKTTLTGDDGETYILLPVPALYQGGAVIRSNQAADPAVHALAVRIAQRCVWIIQAVLREEERRDAAREFYHICREELDKKPSREPEV